jgi:hypothetical protein
VLVLALVERQCLQDVVDVALEVEQPADVGAGQPELVGLLRDVPHGIG